MAFLFYMLRGLLRVIVGRNNANSRMCDRMLENSSRRKRKPHDGRWSAGVGEFWSWHADLITWALKGGKCGWSKYIQENHSGDINNVSCIMLKIWLHSMVISNSFNPFTCSHPTFCRLVWHPGTNSYGIVSNRKEKQVTCVGLINNYGDVWKRTDSLFLWN